MNNTTPEDAGRQIWVDTDVWNRLQLLSRPAESPNDVLRRAILDQVPDGFVTPRKAYLLPLLQALVDLDGSARTDEVQDKMKEHMQSILMPIDYETTKPNGTEIRWKNAARLARNDLVKWGYLTNSSPNGIWEISQKGRAAVQAGRVE